MKLKVGDTVRITAGKDKGLSGKVVKIIVKHAMVLVEGVNKFKKHLKPQGEGKPGGIVERERPLPVASVSLICPVCKQPTRIGYEERDGTKTRICRKCKAPIGK